MFIAHKHVVEAFDGLNPGFLEMPGLLKYYCDELSAAEITRWIEQAASSTNPVAQLEATNDMLEIIFAIVAPIYVAKGYQLTTLEARTLYTIMERAATFEDSAAQVMKFIHRFESVDVRWHATLRRSVEKTYNLERIWLAISIGTAFVEQIGSPILPHGHTFPKTVDQMLKNLAEHKK